MNPRRLTAATLTAAALLVPAAPASATCWLGPVYICESQPTDPYVGEVVLLYNKVLVTALCAAGYTQYCF